jgi:hypothetical protein
VSTPIAGSNPIRAFPKVAPAAEVLPFPFGSVTLPDTLKFTVVVPDSAASALKGTAAVAPKAKAIAVASGVRLVCIEVPCGNF